MSFDRDERREISSDLNFMGFQMAKWMVFSFALLLLLGLVVTLTNLGIGPFVVNQQRHIIQHSLQYYTTETTAMEGFITDFNNLNVSIAQAGTDSTLTSALQAAQKNDVTQVWANFDKLPNDVDSELPSDIQQFMQLHPRDWQPAQ